MNTIYRLSILVLGFLIFASCSKDDLVADEATNTDILISNSPWKFESFELIEIVEKENDTTTGAWVEKIINEDYKDWAIIFKEDGTGVMTFAEEEPYTWTWAFNGDNKICFEGVCDDESFTEIEVANERLSFVSISFSPEDEQGNSAKNKGRYLFK